MYRILVINPGAGSTKIGLFEDERKIRERELRHDPEELRKYETTIDQLEMREKAVLDFLREEGLEPSELHAVIGRGGAFKPLQGGIYRVNERLISDIKEGKVQADHPSNLGALIAHKLASPHGIPAFFADPVSVDEFDEISRLSGLPELPRLSLSHALNTKYVAKKVAASKGKRYEEMNMIVAHLGTGISISPHRKGKMFDVNNANDGGPFSPQRAGTLPTTGLIKLSFSGKYSKKELLRRVTREAGLLAYLGTDDLRKVEERIEAGDGEARLVYDAMVYQIAKEIGAMAAALRGEVDVIILTGGMARSPKIVRDIEGYISWIAPVEVIPGENELEALAYAALRALKGLEEPKEYV